MILLFYQNDSTIMSWFLTLMNALCYCVDDDLQTNLVCGNETLKNSKQEKVLVFTIHNKLNLIRKASIKYYQKS